MEKRYIKKLEAELSPLGFGVMRLPMIGNSFSDEAYCLIEYAMKSGINYYDTGFHYQNSRSEEFLHNSLVLKYPRESFHIADKLPVWDCKSKDDMERIFKIQLERLGVKYIDFYLLHALQKSRWQECYNQGVLDFLDTKRKKGEIRKIGFSLHDNTNTLKSIVNAFDWDFVQLQINYYDWTIQNVNKSYEFLTENEIPCFVMGPVGGGRLSKLPEKAEKILKSAHPNVSVSSWAVRFTASLPNVATTLSGMSNMEQLKDNISYFSPFVPICSKEQEALQKVVKIIQSYSTIPCTSCNYCVDDCPKSVDIVQIFQKYNESKNFPNSGAIPFVTYYFEFINENNRGNSCIGCEKCEKKCPQGIKISKELQKIHEFAIIQFLGVSTQKLEYLSKNEQDSIFICFGAGRRGSVIQPLLSQYGISVRYFCDNSEALWGNEINGIPVISPVELGEIICSNKVNIFITNAAYDAIKSQLEKLNVPNSNLNIIN